MFFKMPVLEFLSLSFTLTHTHTLKGNCLKDLDSFY